jgi:hypothetical protein
MQIVLPGALPDPREARELASHLPDTAPTLVHWLQQSRAVITAADPARAGCTAYEQWLLKSRGFTPDTGQNLSAGLGPLWGSPALAGNPPPSSCHDTAAWPNQTQNAEYTEAAPPYLAEPRQAIWLAELVHVAPSRDGAALLPARDLAITPGQSVALFQSAQSLMEESGFTAYPSGPQHWRLDLHQHSGSPSASPALVAMTAVNDWWPQDIAARPWRRLVNELQMLWFEHPVNQARAAQGLAPINSLWLFGGARPEQFPAAAQIMPCRVCDNLLAPSLKHDWGGWIGALKELEHTVFQPLAQRRITPELVLTGRDRIAELRPARFRSWTHWLPGSRDAWRIWWSPRN